MGRQATRQGRRRGARARKRGPGAVVDLVGAAGRTESWRVEALKVRHKDALPSFPSDGPRRLALVTCGGPVVHTAHGRGYRDNVMVWAAPAAAAAPVATAPSAPADAASTSSTASP
ncbi:class F sortase [Mobilicoccus pelagius]|uniref:Peptidase C60 family protein n=1 Tax=Mobilicoccus pelagius NBRC 104925 TaxID=1089455 RepID=H5URV9_9MICO|nr:class F sortase [Mobilicoccus pelagius]GAB48467.1 hypothetical protein MOPEL_073_01080 [Mobilicoccus pelagius NBRC 104925]